MKIALFGDVHGNVEALNAVLCAAQDQGVSAYLNTGDIVGYYHDPAAVMRRLNSVDAISVRGNHEDLFERYLSDDAARGELTTKYGSGFSVAERTLGISERRCLRDLPVARKLVYDGMNILLAHGAPWSTDQYIYPDCGEATLEQLDESAQGFDLVVLGHTHYQHMWSRNACVIVNPGSAGQPRDRKPGAAWALLDTATGQVELRRETYDNTGIIAKAQKLDPDMPYLWKVLTRT